LITSLVKEDKRELIAEKVRKRGELRVVKEKQKTV